MYLLDTNVIIRFLTNDDEIQSPQAFQLFKKTIEEDLTLVLHPLVIVECCYILQSKRYGYTKEEVKENLFRLIASSNIKTIEKEIVEKALEAFSKHNVDFTDAYIAVTVNLSQDLHSTITWNKKDFKRLSTEFYKPEDILK